MFRRITACAVTPSVQRGMVYNITFIVFFQNTMREKCFTEVVLPPVHLLRLRRRVTKFWCRPVP
ncbi:uncharacterized protein LOC142768486 isoform X2 [Rhipicephalus microplus]|uniref:uncharacterized protein LOC142768486 isoform X2 n=1 Tax=Rhipicephalus microplus TaxID=6941 RepID=UPI003F6C8720